MTVDIVMVTILEPSEKQDPIKTHLILNLESRISVLLNRA